MFDYRLQYAIMVNEDRVRGDRRQILAENRGVKRFFRVPSERTAGRVFERR